MGPPAPYAEGRTQSRTAADKLVAFAAHKIRTCDELNRAKLMEFKAVLVRAPKRVAVKEGQRGAYAPSTQQRRLAAVNRELRSTRTLL